MALHLYIADSLTQKEWETVYEETLVLLEKFPLCEKVHKHYFGKDLLCFSKSTERTISNQLSWQVVGDYKTLQSAEVFSLNRTLGEMPKKPTKHDVFLGLLPLINQESFKKIQKPFKDLWGHQTKGNYYKGYLLAIGALIESRLKGKVAVFGNYTLKELVTATRNANRYLEKPIDLTDRADTRKLYERVQTLPLSNVQKIAALYALYLGDQKAAFGSLINESFAQKDIEAFWEDAFSKHPLTSDAFFETFRQAIISGLHLRELRRYIPFTEHLGGEFYKRFVHKTIELNLNLKRKEKRLTKEELKNVLNETVGQFCPVNQLLDFYLLQHKKPVNVRKKETTEVKRSRLKQPVSTYLETELLDMVNFCNQLLAGTHFKKLMKASPEDRCRFIMDQSHKLQLLEKDWKKIFNDIMKKEETFRMYYPMAWLEDPTGDVSEILKAIAFDKNVYLHVLARKKAC